MGADLLSLGEASAAFDVVDEEETADQQ